MRNAIDIIIRVPNQTQYLRFIGSIAENMAQELRRLAINHDFTANYLNIVLTEAMANAIMHANAADPNKEIRIRVRISDKLLKINVYDNGLGFDLDSVPCPNFDSNCLKETGRGIYIIKSLMDIVRYKKTRRGNVLEMVKLLKKLE